MRSCHLLITYKFLHVLLYFGDDDVVIRIEYILNFWVNESVCQVRHNVEEKSFAPVRVAQESALRTRALFMSVKSRGTSMFFSVIFLLPLKI